MPSLEKVSTGSVPLKKNDIVGSAVESTGTSRPAISRESNGGSSYGGLSLITVMTCEVCGPENVTHVPSAGTQTVNLPKSYWPVIGDSGCASRAFVLN